MFILPCWAYGFIWALFPILGWSSYGKETDTGYRCGLNFREHSSNVVSYNASLAVAAFLLPITIAVICNRRIICAYKRLYGQAASRNSQMQRDTHEQLHKTYIISIVMFVAFALAWSPYAIIVVLNMFGVQPKQNLLDIAAITAKTSAAYNPIIYALIYKEFRNRMHKFMQLCKKPALLQRKKHPKKASKSEENISMDTFSQPLAHPDVCNQSSIKDINSNNQNKIHSIGKKLQCSNIIQPDVKEITSQRINSEEQLKSNNSRSYFEVSSSSLPNAAAATTATTKCAKNVSILLVRESEVPCNAIEI